MRYFPSELHCHTVHSDGGFLPQELQAAAKAEGLSLIALTDHNTFSGYEMLDPAILPVIKGIEWTTYFGHMLVLGAEDFVDWRDALPDNIDGKLKKIRAKNGIIGIAHPFQLGSPMCTGGHWEFNVRDFSLIDYIEIWHEAFYVGNYENKRAFAFWTALLDQGYHLAATYGRDWHRPTEGNFGCTYLGIEGTPNAENALAAIRSGRTVVSSGAKLFFKVYQNGGFYEIGDTIEAGEATFGIYTDTHARSSSRIAFTSIRLVTNGGSCIAEAPVTQTKITVTLNAKSWYRTELWGTLDGAELLLAVTSPIYTK